MLPVSRGSACKHTASPRGLHFSQPRGFSETLHLKNECLTLLEGNWTVFDGLSLQPDCQSVRFSGSSTSPRLA